MNTSVEALIVIEGPAADLTAARRKEDTGNVPVIMLCCSTCKVDLEDLDLV